MSKNQIKAAELVVAPVTDLVAPPVAEAAPAVPEVPPVVEGGGGGAQLGTEAAAESSVERVAAFVLCDTYVRGEKIPCGSVVVLPPAEVNGDMDLSDGAVTHALDTGVEPIHLD